ncbi:release factor glutamine methyltransferase [Streptomyces zagrosensis]|uniref:peptide chain release factor N(5)-glutamine methyltransferase n=1 Tax=Streptomyces zagrosensis TaxID=1042984 RepID=A0A7W9Q6W2_9ACTN|nr:release factor glutamine methyltransferase [Streptomyces zagrosensis]
MSPSLSRSTLVSRLRAAGCVFAEDEARLLFSTARTPDELDAMMRRRVAGLPLEHVLGWAEFCGLRIAVDPEVFVPRRRTEFLVRQAIAHAHARARALRAAEALPSAGAVVAAGRTVVVDLCCGTGAVGAALVAALGPDVELYAADVDPVAVRCASRNVSSFGGRVYVGDLFAPLPGALRGRIEVLAANVPYVPTGAVGLLPSEAREYEPLVALDGGADGLDVLRRVAAAAPNWLAPGGCVLVETSEGQAAEAVAAFVRAGLTARVATSDELTATVVIGTRAGPA